MGVEIAAGYFRPSLRNWLAARKAPIDYVLLNRPEVAAAHLEILRAAKLPILYYGHDLHFARLAMEAKKSTDPAAAQRAAEMQRLEHAIWRRANVSTYPSADEAEQVAVLEPQAAARPLMAFCFDDFPERQTAPSSAQIIFVGSFRHPPNIAAAELLARSIFPLVRKQIPEARLVIAGAYATEGVKALAGAGVEVAGWLSDEDLTALYARSRLAVVPLEVGAGIKLKVVEALSKGIPLVTTPVGAQGLSGLGQLFPVCEGAAEMADAAARLLRLDDKAWLQQSRAAVQYAREHFSRQAMNRSLEEALQLAAATRSVE
jgi:glycosyltransferase involved in cell wall biosynthesis